MAALGIVRDLAVKYVCADEPRSRPSRSMSRKKQGWIAGLISAVCHLFGLLLLGTSVPSTSRHRVEIRQFEPIVAMILVGFLVAMLALCCKWQTAATAVDSYPGLDFVPRPDPANADDTLIYYKLSNEASVNKLTTKIDQFLQQYKGGLNSQNLFSCSAMYPLPPGDKVCEVSPRWFEPCIAENSYNYKRAAPCVFLKLDKVLNWTPNPYNKSEELPTDMPADLKEHIKNVEQTDRSAANSVWVSCEGENPADVEFIGPVEYHPKRGFPSYFFPVTSSNQKDFLSPLVAVQFKRPAMGIVINIECKAWAKNIFHDRYEKRGSVHFELMVDP